MFNKRASDVYGTTVEPDVDDKAGHVRTLISGVRASQLHEAEDNWTAALAQNKSYSPFAEVSTCGVIYLFISLARFQSVCVDGCSGKRQGSKKTPVLDAWARDISV